MRRGLLEVCDESFAQAIVDHNGQWMRERDIEEGEITLSHTVYVGGLAFRTTSTMEIVEEEGGPLEDAHMDAQRGEMLRMLMEDMDAICEQLIK